MTEPANKFEERYPLWDRWFRRVKHEFCPLLLPFAGKPVIYVEIGCWAGASGEWVAQNILTHPNSLGIGIDPYPVERRHPQEEIDAIRWRAESRIHEVIGNRWHWFHSPSAELLRYSACTICYQRPIDILYIDGDHSAPAVVQDFALAWPFLKPGSIVIFDDYKKGKPHPFPHVAEAYRSIRISWKGLIEPCRPDSFHNYQRAVTVLKKEHSGG